MMLGSTSALPQQQPLSANGSAMDVDSKHESGEEHVRMPPGLQNLGNTCYMNATLQSFLVCSIYVLHDMNIMLKVIPELVNGISKWTSTGSTKATSDMLKQYTGSIHTLFQSLTTGDKESYTPLLQLTVCWMLQ